MCCELSVLRGEAAKEGRMLPRAEATTTNAGASCWCLDRRVETLDSYEIDLPFLRVFSGPTFFSFFFLPQFCG